MDKLKKLVQPLVILLLLILLFQVKKCSYRDGLKDGVVKSDNIHHQQITQYEDKFGNLHSQVKTLEGTISELKIVHEQELSHKAAELNTKVKNIKGVVNITTERRVNIDSLVRANARFDTIHIKGKDTTLYIARTDSLFLPFYDSMSITEYRKRVGWFKHQTYIDVATYNPSVKVKSIDGFHVTDYQTNLNFGPIISCDFKGNIQYGIGLQFKLFGFRLGKH